MDTRSYHHAPAHEDHPHHVAGRHRSHEHRIHPQVRHLLRIVLLVLFTHFLMHLGWYAFDTLWTHELGLIDPKTLGKQLAGATSVPLVVIAIGALAWLQSLLE